MKKLVVFFCVLLIYTTGESQVIQPGEYLEYEVSFWNVKLGSIKITTCHAEKVYGNTAFKVVANVNSYSGIPFVDLNSVMTTFLDSSALFTFKYTEAKKYEDDIWDFQQLIFDYSAGKINEHYWRAKKLIKKNTTLTSQKWCDGLALIFHARQNCNSKRTEYIPTTVFSDTANTTIIYSGKREKVRIESMPTPVRCWYFDGVANWKGIYGLSGRFRGWFSDDLSRVPILAKMNVYVGDVVIQLVKWKKAGWKPPG